jgi:hypothetical protein
LAEQEIAHDQTEPKKRGRSPTSMEMGEKSRSIHHSSKMIKPKASASNEELRVQGGRHFHLKSGNKNSQVQHYCIFLAPAL